MEETKEKGEKDEEEEEEEEGKEEDERATALAIAARWLTRSLGRTRSGGIKEIR